MAMMVMSASADAPIVVQLNAKLGPIVVGQAIEIDLQLDSTSNSPTFEPPQVIGALVIAVENQGRPASARFVVLPRKPGVLEIPSFRVRQDGRSGGSRPLQRTIAATPSAGRTSAFLGGVGSFEIGASIDRPTLQAGQALEYRIKMTGTAAWGSEQSPDLSSWAAKIPGLRVEPLASRLAPTDPPTRTFLYRLRPLKGGQLVLPPVAVAAFDPSSQTFRTRVTPRLIVEVAAPPTFNPAVIDEGVHEQPSSSWQSWRITKITSLGLMVALPSISAWLIWHRADMRKRRDPRRLAAKLAASLDHGWSDHEAAKRITEGFATFLQDARGRNPGVLTPPETVEAFASLSGDLELARSAGQLIERCDRFNYGRIESSESNLVDEAKRVLGGLVEGKGGEQPREAVETV